MWWEYFSFKFCPVFHQSALELSYFDQNWAKTRPLLFKIWKFSNSMDSRIVQWDAYLLLIRNFFGLCKFILRTKAIWSHLEMPFMRTMCNLVSPPILLCLDTPLSWWTRTEYQHMSTPNSESKSMPWLIKLLENEKDISAPDFPSISIPCTAGPNVCHS